LVSALHTVGRRWTVNLYWRSALRLTIDSGLVVSTDFRSSHGRGSARADDAQGTPTQSHISPSIVYEDNDETRFSRTDLDSGHQEGSYLRLIDFVSINSRLESSKEED